MKKVLLPIFLIRLMFALLPFFCQLIWASFSWSTTLLFSVLVLVFQMSFFANYFYSQRNTSLVAVVLNHFSQQKTQYLLDQRSRMEQIKKIQPTDQEILLNVALISRQLKDEEGCQQAFQQAFYLNPNTQFFQQHSPNFCKK
jgi:hypothetical protein